MLHTLRIELVIPEKINTSVMYINQADPFFYLLSFLVDVLNQFVEKHPTDIEVLYHLIHYQELVDGIRMPHVQLL